MKNSTQYAQQLQDLFQKIPQIAEETQFIQRTRTITPANFITSVVLTWQQNPNASLQDFVDAFEEQNISISKQAVSQRFTSVTENFLRQTLAAALLLLSRTDQDDIGVSRLFNGIYVTDCTDIPLPDDLAESYPACGGSDKTVRLAALKTLCRIEITRGNIDALQIDTGKTADIKINNQTAPLPSGALDLKDMGFFCIPNLRRDSEQGIEWITRIPAGVKTMIHWDDQEIPLISFLSHFEGGEFDLPGIIGTEKYGVRLTGFRLDAKTAAERLRKKRREAQKHGRKVSEEQSILCQWSIYATNISEQKCGTQVIGALYRVRWQVELLFKLWKSEGQLDKTKGLTGRRCLCEFYAKLLGLVLANRAMLLRCGRLGGVSAVRLYRAVRWGMERLQWKLMEGGMRTLADWEKWVDSIVRRLERIPPQQRRKKKPTTAQLLEISIT
jgi:hypothetical protein